MDKDVIIAIIASAGTIIAGIGAVVIPIVVTARRNARKRQTEAKESETAAAEASAKTIRRVPYRIDLVRHIVATDASGLVSVTREFRGIRARNGEKLSRFRTQLTAAGPAQFNDIKAVTVTHSNIGKGIKIEKTLTNPKTCDIVLEIIGELLDTDQALDVTVTTSMLNAVLLKAADIEAAYGKQPFPFEYVAEAVDAEVDQLEIRVSFPPDSRPQTWPMVFYRDSEKRANEALRQIPALDESVNGIAQLRIVSPPPLFRYAVYWIGLP